MLQTANTFCNTKWQLYLAENKQKYLENNVLHKKQQHLKESVKVHIFYKYMGKVFAK